MIMSMVRGESKANETATVHVSAIATTLATFEIANSSDIHLSLESIASAVSDDEPTVLEGGIAICKLASAPSKKRGLSVEEKRRRMMEFFFEKKDFFQLKELEKLCQKEKGITSMSVKDILTSLVDDDMVDTEKIGTSVYFWAFPSKASQNRKRKIQELESKLQHTEAKRKTMEEEIIKARMGKEDSVSLAC
ncbi:hypothetical protein LSH36_109g02033 [Paralvinella palmiformis]|uniref:Mnd1 HTH domain-containing protein n=1 Tax=Paralvinella palmiformis TaxID=53620 RepID=A0AAD9JZB0_9ANNE|nr:hypothetical protein LSH36_109g02033 [Paralvinella palmiformis]